MKLATVVRLLGLAALVLALLLWANSLSASSVMPPTIPNQSLHGDGGACAAGYASYPSGDPPAQPPYECYELDSDTLCCRLRAGSGSSSGPFSSFSPVGSPRWAGLGSPPKNSKLIGAAGGSLDSPGGDATVTVPSGVDSNGTTVSISQPYPNGLPRGTFVLRGDGDHWDAVSFTDANGNPITSFSGNITLCFNLTPSEITNAGGVQNLSIQFWDGGSWVTVPMTATAPVPPATTTQVCTQFSSL